MYISHQTDIFSSCVVGDFCSFYQTDLHIAAGFSLTANASRYLSSIYSLEICILGWNKFHIPFHLVGGSSFLRVCCAGGLCGQRQGISLVPPLLKSSLQEWYTGLTDSSYQTGPELNPHQDSLPQGEREWKREEELAQELFVSVKVLLFFLAELFWHE